MKFTLIKAFFYGLCLSLLLGGCAGQQAVVDFLPGMDFSTYKTYAWKPVPTDSKDSHRAKNELLDKRIIEAVDRNMTAKGFRKVAKESAHMVVNYHVSASEQERHSSGRISIGSSHFSGHSALGFSISVPVGGRRSYKEGTLVIDIIDNQKKELIWQASATRSVRDDIKPERLSAIVNEVVEEILEKFPPK